MKIGVFTKKISLNVNAFDMADYLNITTSINATGGSENDINNLGVLEILYVTIQNSGEYRRLNFEN